MHKPHGEKSEFIEAPPYEKRDVNIRLIVITLISVVVITVAALIGMVWLEQAFYETGGTVVTERLPDVARQTTLRLPAPGPQLQNNPEADLDRYKTESEAGLTSYGWVDRDSRIVHIPVKEAMRRMIEQGPPTWAPAQPAETPAAPADAAESPASPAATVNE